MYTEVHRALLTLVRSDKYVSISELQNRFHTLVQAIAPEILETNDPLDTVLDRHIAAINTRIGPHGFRIDKRTHEVSGEIYYIFINTLNDETAKLNTSYAPKELEGIKEIVDQIVESAPDYCIGRGNAEKSLSYQVKSLGQASEFVDQLIDEGWVVLTTENKLVLSLRALSELKTYLVDKYGVSTRDTVGKILVCKQCKDIVTLGYSYNVEDAFHYKCHEVYHNAGGLDRDSAPSRVGVDPRTFS